MRRIIVGCILFFATNIIVYFLFISSFMYFHLRPENRERSIFPESWHNYGLLGSDAPLIIGVISIVISIFSLLFYLHKTRTGYNMANEINEEEKELDLQRVPLVGREIQMFYRKIKEFKNKYPVGITFMIPYVCILMIFWDEGWSSCDSIFSLINLIIPQLIFAVIPMLIIVLISLLIAFFKSVNIGYKNFWKIASFISIIQTIILSLYFKLVIQNPFGQGW